MGLPRFTGVTELDGVVYCIGGTYGPSGTKYCFKLTDTEDKWDRIANMLTGEINIIIYRRLHVK